MRIRLSVGSMSCGALFLAGFVGSVVALRASTADAAWIRWSQCRYAGTGDAAAANGSRDVNKTVPCPFPDTSVIPKMSVTQLNVHGYDNSTKNSVIARACISYWYTDGAECGSWVYSGDSHKGDYTLSPPLTKWAANDGNFAYVAVSMDIKTSTGVMNTVRGMYAYAP